MKTISTQARLLSLAMALVATTVVLGSTVAGMQWSAESQPALVVMEKVDRQADRSAVNRAPVRPIGWRSARSCLRRRARTDSAQANSPASAGLFSFGARPRRPRHGQGA